MPYLLQWIKGYQGLFFVLIVDFVHKYMNFYSMNLSLFLETDNLRRSYEKITSLRRWFNGMTTRQVPTKNATYRTKQFKSVSYLPHFLFVNLLLMGWQQNIFDTYLPRRKSFVVSGVGSNEQFFQISVFWINQVL